MATQLKGFWLERSMTWMSCIAAFIATTAFQVSAEEQRNTTRTSVSTRTSTVSRAPSVRRAQTVQTVTRNAVVNNSNRIPSSRAPVFINSRRGIWFYNNGQPGLSYWPNQGYYNPSFYNPNFYRNPIARTSYYYPRNYRTYYVPRSVPRYDLYDFNDSEEIASPVAAAKVEPRMQPVSFKVNVPDNAKVWFEGSLKPSTGNVRQFATQELKPGNYAFVVRAEWTEFGKVRSQTQEVYGHPGDQVDVHFPFKGE